MRFRPWQRRPPDCPARRQDFGAAHARQESRAAAGHGGRNQETARTEVEVLRLLRYPVQLEREGKYVLASFPSLPGVHTYGKDREEALSRAVSALETMLMALIDDRKRIPAPRAV